MLRKLGYQEVLPRTAQRLCECDVAFLAPRLDALGRVQPPLAQSVLDMDAWPELARGDDATLVLAR
jgi:hypothetical protein